MAVGAFTATLIVTPLAIFLAKSKGWVDFPNERKIHKVPMPRIGGLGIFAGIVVGVILAGFLEKQTWPFLLLIPLSLISTMGFVDDVRELSFKTKFAVQILAGVLAVFLVGANVPAIANPFDQTKMNFDIFGPVIAVIWMVGITNAINLSDGLDGLAAGISAIAALTLAVTSARVNITTALVALSVFASSIAFLRYNFHPAKTFMGDTGSQLLGFSLAVISIKGASLSASTLSLAVPILAIGIPILDTTYAFIRRMRRGGNPFLPDKMHIHHQLLSIGFSHVGAVIFIYAISFSLALIAMFFRGKHVLTFLAFYVLVAIGLLAFLKVMRNKNGR